MPTRTSRPTVTVTTVTSPPSSPTSAASESSPPPPPPTITRQEPATQTNEPPGDTQPDEEDAASDSSSLVAVIIDVLSEEHRDFHATASPVPPRAASPVIMTAAAAAAASTTTRSSSSSSSSSGNSTNSKSSPMPLVPITTTTTLATGTATMCEDTIATATIGGGSVSHFSSSSSSSSSFFAPPLPPPVFASSALRAVAVTVNPGPAAAASSVLLLARRNHNGSSDDSSRRSNDDSNSQMETGIEEQGLPKGVYTEVLPDPSCTTLPEPKSGVFDPLSNHQYHYNHHREEAESEENDDDDNDDAESTNETQLAFSPPAEHDDDDGHDDDTDVVENKGSKNTKKPQDDETDDANDDPEDLRHALTKPSTSSEDNTTVDDGSGSGSGQKQRRRQKQQQRQQRWMETFWRRPFFQRQDQRKPQASPPRPARVEAAATMMTTERAFSRLDSGPEREKLQQDDEANKRHVMWTLVIASFLICIIVVAIVVPISHAQGQAMAMIAAKQHQQNSSNNHNQSSTTTVPPTTPAQQLPASYNVTAPFHFTPQLSNAEMLTNEQELNAILQPVYESYRLSHLFNGIVVGDGSPQAKAFVWMAGSATYATANYSSWQKIQRYVLGVFYYSTYQQAHPYSPNGGVHATVAPWTSSLYWMSPLSECEWEGIVCQQSSINNNNDVVTAIVLPEHHLSGTLPPELNFLNASLVTLNLTANEIYVNGDEIATENVNATPFTFLGNLQTLALDNNYVVTKGSGLPPAMLGLVQLEKLVLSYNILQGPLQNSAALFGQWSKLTHLEAESNYLVGDFPDNILSSTSLLYLYMRRNQLTVNLPRLLGPTTLPSLFALWLDNNIITGGIPSTINVHTNLASLSIANASLSGTLPSELGQLTNLARVWLYTNRLAGSIPASLANWRHIQVLELFQNDLTGTMPVGLCIAIANSSYALKELSADCTQVMCLHCCTVCYP